MDSLLIPITVVLLVYFVYKWATLNNDYFVKRNVKHLKPTILLGNTGPYFMKMIRPNEFFHSLYNSFPKEKIFGMFDFRQPMLLIRDPELVRKIGVKDFDHFEDHKLFFESHQDVLFGKSLIMLNGEKWREMRNTLSPSFTGSKMRLMFDMVGKCAFDMSEHFKAQAKSGKILNLEMKNMFAKCTNDVIATAAFGISVDSFADENNDFFVTGKRITDFGNFRSAIKLVLLRAAPAIMKALDIQFIDADARKYFRSIVLDTMDIREKQNIIRPDMINLLMPLRRGGSINSQTQEKSAASNVVKRTWTDDDIVAQCFIFMAGGFETSATLLSFMAYELARNPEVQEKLYAEVKALNERLQGKAVPYDELHQMKYMDMVISESLRMWPPATFVDRLCVKDYAYEDENTSLVIEKGTSVWFPIYSFHHDPLYFPQPDQFNPERFSDENVKNIVPGAYLPFGIGPRNCIGSRFALMQVKATIYYLLLNFKFQPNEETQIPLKLKKIAITILTEKGIHLQLKLR